jgi:phospholipid transport system substrate-binding protein
MKMGQASWRMLIVLIVLAFSGVSGTAPALGAPAAGGSAHDMVQSATDLLLNKLAEVKHLYAQEPVTFYREVESALVPYIDFDRFSRGVMAKYYRRATPAQREKFKDVFKDDLIRTYATALVEFDNERIRVLPPGNTKPKKADKTTVKMEVHSKNGTIYPVDYTTMLSNGQWKLINVRVNGINLGLQFRQKFGHAMGSKKGDIGQVIDSWNSEVATET